MFKYPHHRIQHCFGYTGAGNRTGGTEGLCSIELMPLPISDIVFLSSTGVLGAGTIAFLKITDRKTQDFFLGAALARDWDVYR